MTILGRLSYLMLGGLLTMAFFAPEMVGRLNAVRSAALVGGVSGAALGCAEARKDQSKSCRDIAMGHADNLNRIINDTESALIKVQ